MGVLYWECLVNILGSIFILFIFKSWKELLFILVLNKFMLDSRVVVLIYYLRKDFLIVNLMFVKYLFFYKELFDFMVLVLVSKGIM